MTMAPGCERFASAKMRFEGFRLLTTLPVASIPQRFNSSTASATMSCCCCHSRLVGMSPGCGKPKALPHMRAIEKTWIGAFALHERRAANSTAFAGMGLPSEARRTDAGEKLCGSGGAGTELHGQRRGNVSAIMYPRR